MEKGAEQNGQDVLSVESLDFSYGTDHVLKAASLTVRRGEIFGLVGLNGAGKTTLIKTVLGLSDPDSGTIRVLGRSRRDRYARENMSFLPERFDPPWFLTGYGFIRFSLSLYGAHTCKKDIHQAADFLSLERASLKRKVQSYSKGMRQKLGLIATALVPCPLLILDEPMSGLDPQARAQVKKLMFSARDRGQTVFFSSHILSDIDEICDRIGVLHDGRVMYEGAPGGLKSAAGYADLEKSFLKYVGVPQDSA